MLTYVPASAIFAVALAHRRHVPVVYVYIQPTILKQFRAVRLHDTECPIESLWLKDTGIAGEVVSAHEIGLGDGAGEGGVHFTGYIRTYRRATRIA